MNKFYTQDKQLDNSYISEKFPQEWEYLSQIDSEIDLRFEVHAKRIMLVNDFGKPLFIDIEKKLKYHRSYFSKNSIYKELFAKALGVKKGSPFPLVLDSTGGLLGDTLLMTSYGLEVDVIERNPLVSMLIVNALRNSSTQINFNQLAAQELDKYYPVIFFDPMYAEKNKKSAPKKEMQVFRSIVGEDIDRLEVANHLFNLTNRLVIKRSIKASPLILRPNMTFSGKSTCYDVYLNN